MTTTTEADCPAHQILMSMTIPSDPHAIMPHPEKPAFYIYNWEGWQHITAGMMIETDLIDYSMTLLPGMDAIDESFFGSQFILSRWTSKPPVNIKVIGRKILHTSKGRCVRVRVEYVQDGEPSIYEKGYVYF